jgi:hypothetical protein
MRFTIKITFLMLFWGFNTYGQEKFMVTKLSGEAWINNTKLMVGSSFVLNDADQLWVYSDIILRHLNTGGTIRVPKPDTVSMKELFDKLKAAQTNSGDKLVAYVYGQVVSSNENIIDNHRKYMRVTGSVERSNNSANIKFFLSNEKYIVYNTKDIIITWYPIKGVETYIVKFTDAFDQKILEEEINDTVFNFQLLEQAEDKQAICTIKAKDKPDKISEKLLITSIDKDYAKIDSEYKSFRKDNKLIDNDVQSKITDAYFFENEGLYADAITAYISAIELCNNDDEKVGLRAVYKQFIEQIIPIIEEQSKK